jgi:hypothetical protein
VTRLKENSDEQSGITAVKVSTLGQYLVIMYRDVPFELWDFRTCSLLKIMPQSFPLVAGLEWSVTGLPRKGKGDVAPAGTGGGISRTASMMNAGGDGLMSAVANKPTSMVSPTQRFNHRGAPESNTAYVPRPPPPHTHTI